MLLVSLLLVLLQSKEGNCEISGNGTSNQTEPTTWKHLIYSVRGPDEFAKNLTMLLESHDSIFKYKFYQSPSREGIAYLEARNLCLELGSFPAVILSEKQHAEVQDLLFRANVTDAWTGLTFLETGALKGLLWDTGTDMFFSADDFFLNNLPSTHSNDSFSSPANRSIEKSSPENSQVGTVTDGNVEPGTINDPKESSLHFTMLQFGEYQPKIPEYVASGFVCSNFSVSLIEETGGNKDQPTGNYDMVKNVTDPYENEGDENEGDGNEGDENERDVYEGDEDEEDENEGDENEGDVKEGDKNEGDEYKGDKNEGDVNEGDGNEGDEYEGDENEGDENEENVNEGDANEGDENEVNENEGDFFESALFQEMYIDYIVREHFSSFKLEVLQSETGIRFDESEEICYENGVSPALLLTEEVNLKAHKLMTSEGVSDAWIGLIYNHSSIQLSWGNSSSTGMYFNSSKYYMNNLRSFNCDNCNLRYSYSPAILHQNGSWELVDGDYLSGAVLCMDIESEVAESIMGNFFLYEIPHASEFDILFLKEPANWINAAEMCSQTFGISFLSPVVTPYLQRKVDNLLKATRPVPDLAWTGLIFTDKGFLAPYSYYNFSYTGEDIDSRLHEKSREVMDLVTKGEIDAAPVAITSEGLFVVLHLNSTVEAVICSTINPDLLRLKEDPGIG